MDFLRLAVRASVFMALVVVGILVSLSASTGGADIPSAVTTREGGPFTLPTTEGVYPALWDDVPIAVFVTGSDRLEGVEATRGQGEATPSIALPNGLRMFALSAKSTHLGCTVGMNHELGASKDIADYDGDGEPDGRLLDPCAQGQWDPWNHGAPIEGTPTNGRRLAILDIAIDGDGLEATGFDGPIGPPK